jgi:benzoyl-CoA reductase/2-hydroxyglutaryl-CoA dehydratase subunit BcrC/BadD/HgdB
MWAGLKLDLAAHDRLLKVLGQAYTDIYLTQQNRPQSMTYLDFVLTEIHGLRIEELLAAKRAGRKVIGTFCTYVPEEIILAADGTCVGLCAGGDIGIEHAERYLPQNTCALIKSFVGFKLAGVCPYVEACDLVVGETTCDGKKKAYEVFGDFVNMFVIETPQMKTAADHALWRSEIGRLTEKIEALTGRTITLEKLRQATRLVNAKRQALHRLNTLRRADPAPISGRDALLINQVQFFDDPARLTAQINVLCDELQARVAQGIGAAPAGTPRILVSGCPMAAPNWKVPYLVEKNGAVIVGEESCVGERGTRNLVDEDGPTRDALLDRIAQRYLKIDCACFTPNTERLDHIVQMARDYRADGVIDYAIQFCTPYAMESFRVKQRLQQEGIPVLKLETDYSMRDVAQLETRIQAFLEVLKAPRGRG